MGRSVTTRVHDDIFDRRIDVQVPSLGRKLKRDPGAPRLVRTEGGIGWTRSSTPPSEAI